ncbi:MAG: PqqD family peptide modification chaperone [Pyrinomonadaceae bacterium]
MAIRASDQAPRARKDRLIIKDLPDETLVYDLETDKAHCLNNTSALVWKHCDGRNTVSDISEILAAQAKTDANDAVVWLALDQLEKFDLLEAAPAAPVHLAGINRRQLVRNVGFAALALPIIISIAAPTAEAQASCKAAGDACGSNNQCCSNQCCGSPGVPACPVNNVCL